MRSSPTASAGNASASHRRGTLVDASWLRDAGRLMSCEIFDAEPDGCAEKWDVDLAALALSAGSDTHDPTGQPDLNRIGQSSPQLPPVLNHALVDRSGCGCVPLRTLTGQSRRSTGR
jgi:hypothetical protein